MSRMMRAAALSAALIAIASVAGRAPAAGPGFGPPGVAAGDAADWAAAAESPLRDEVDFQAFLPNRAGHTPESYRGALFRPAPCAAAPYPDRCSVPMGVADCYEGGYAPVGVPGMCVEACRPTPVWTATAGGLLLNIHTRSHYYFSYDDADESRQLTDWHDTDIEWDGGFEVVLRRFDPCTCSGCELVYWQLLADPGTTTTTAGDVGGLLNGILNWDQLNYNGNMASTYVNNAMVHRLSRDVDLYNVELSHVAYVHPASCAPWNVHALFGARVLRFEDQLEFAADTTDGMFTHAADELYYDVQTENTLYGLQAGLWSQQSLARRVSLAMGAKAGVYGNHINAYSRIGGAAGTATVNNGPNSGRQFLVDVDKDDVAMLAELQCELQFELAQHTTASLGYRAMGVSGVAVSVDQIYHDLRGLQDVEQIDSDGTLLLHGVRVYVEQRF